MDRIDLPLEAVSINGMYIEDAIEGYMTVLTSGREGISRELNTYIVGAADGETYKASRVPARQITVDFALHGSDMTDLRSKLNHLNNILSQDQADFVFNDEADKFFTGWTIMNEDFKPYKNAVTGSYTIYCEYPFKRSVEPITLSSTDEEGVVVSGNTATFTFNYNGTYPARPILQAQFAGALTDGDYSEDGDCGYVAFMDNEDNIIQLGNPDAVDIDAYTSAATLVNRSFTTLSDWQTAGGKSWGNKVVNGSLSVGNISDPYWNKGKGQTMSYARPSHVSSSGWHGPILWQDISGAVNYDVALVHRMCVGANDQLGTFECGIYNSDSNVMVAGFVIEKTGSGTNGVVRYIVNGVSVGTVTIDLAYYNTNFGYCKRTAVYTTQKYTVTVTKKVKGKKKKVKETRTRQVQTGWSYTQSNLNSTIKKQGAQVTFKIGNLAAKTFTNADIEHMVSNRISFHFGRSGTSPVMNTCALQSVRFTRQPSASFADIPNVFTAGDIVEADCNDASVYLLHEGTIEGQLAPMFGALGNNWESFQLERGTNVITAVWSDWVNPDYKPTIRIIYNEVFI